MATAMMQTRTKGGVADDYNDGIHDHGDDDETNIDCKDTDDNDDDWDFQQR